MWWVEGHREFADWVQKNYEIESLSNMIQETQKRNGTITTKMFWNPDRYYPEVGDYVTDVSAGPHRLTYVGKVVKRYKGKRPHYDVEILYSYNGKKKTDTNKEGYFLAKIYKEDHWKPWE
jgi:uncharacterized protein (DUF2141 family)